MFDYVMVLASIVIGLAVTHLMMGVAGLVQHPGRDRIWWVHLGWVGFMLLTTVFWWWWEFRLQDIAAWTFQLYLFVLAYAFLFYLICALLFPRDLEGYDGWRGYFLSRRRWIFGLSLLTLAMDFFDTAAKGAAHFASLGWEYPAIQGVMAALFVAGMATRRDWAQGAIVTVALAVQAARAVAFFGTVA